MTPTEWLLSVASGCGIALSGAIAALWHKSESRADETIDAMRKQANASETRAIASDQARNVAEKRAGELELKYAFLKQQWQRTVEALSHAQVMVDPGALVGTISSPPGPEEPTGVWAIEADRRASYFLADRDEAERRRQRSLNPDADRRERERVDAIARGYVLDVDARRR